MSLGVMLHLRKPALCSYCYIGASNFIRHVSDSTCLGCWACCLYKDEFRPFLDLCPDWCVPHLHVDAWNQLHWTSTAQWKSLGFPVIKAIASTGASALRPPLAQDLVTVRQGSSVIRFLACAGPAMNVHLMHQCLALASALTPARTVRLVHFHRCWLPCPA